MCESGTSPFARIFFSRGVARQPLRRGAVSQSPNARTCARRAVRAEVVVRAPLLTSHAVVPCATRTRRWTSPPNSTPEQIVWCACNPDPWWCSRRVGTPRCADRARYDSEHEPRCVRENDACHSERNVHGHAIVHTALPQEKLPFGVHSLLVGTNFFSIFTLYTHTHARMPRRRRSSSCRRRGRRCRTSRSPKRSGRRRSRRTRRVPPVIGFPAGASNEPWFYSESTSSEPVRATVIKLPKPETLDVDTQTTSSLATTTTATQVPSARTTSSPATTTTATQVPSARSTSTETQTPPSPRAPIPASATQSDADEWLRREYDRGRVRSIDDGSVVRERTRDRITGHFID